MTPFTAHNIVLPDGTHTFTGTPIADTPMMKAAIRSLRMAIPRDDGHRVADLGCLEGGWSVALARADFDVLGIEGREDNFRKCCWVLNQFKNEPLPLEFRLDDVRNIKKYGRFDAVVCSGLLYHLDHPAAFLKTLSEVTDVLLLHTHYSTERPNALYPQSQMETHEGNSGRWCPDLPSSGPWAALTNDRAFWIEKKCLLQTLRNVGFDSVYEQFDFLDNVITDPYIQKHDRSMFLAVKS